MEISEFDFIDKIRQDCSEKAFTEGLGIGDDCAVIPYTEDKVYLISKDLLIEGVHFEFNNITLKDLGWKSVAVNLSDIAAMAGTPLYVFIGISVPSSLSSSGLSLFYDGVKEAADSFGIFLLGGDTTASLKDFMVSVTVVGSCLKDKVLYRSGANMGDNIYVTGTLGDVGGGFVLSNEDYEVSDKVRSYLLSKHKRPTPRIKEMLYLSDSYNLTGGIDISDGLSKDVSHIAKESGYGAIINSPSLPLSKQLRSLSGYTDIKKLGLSFGEDYEVLFTCRDDIPLTGIIEFNGRFGIPLTKIGTITTKGLYIKDELGTKPLLAEGYDHFV